MTEDANINKEILYKETLSNVFLSLSSASENLKDLAYAKLIFIVLYIENTPLNLNEIIKKTSDFISSYGLPEESAIKGLKLLEIEKKILSSKDGWFIIDNVKKDVERKISYSKEISSKLCKKYFPVSSFGINTVLKWFEEANLVYFSGYANSLIKVFKEKKRMLINVEEAIIPVINNFGLSKIEKELLQGYKEFLLDDDRESEEKVWNLMQAILSTKFVSSDISPSYFCLEKYKNAEVILDTNILFANILVLKDGELSRCIEPFGSVAKSLGMKLFITEHTITEFDSVCERKKEECIKIWDTYSEEILRKSNDVFIKTLLKYGCKNTSDVKTFFESLNFFKEKIGESKIEVLKNYSSYDQSNKDDSKLYLDIKNAWREMRSYEKSENALIHDVLLSKIVNKLSKNKNIFVLTLDMSMEVLSVREINEKEDPTWRSIFSLIQILALNGGGPEFGQSNISSLMKIFIEQESLYSVNSYDERDLVMLYEIEEKIGELPDVKIISFLNKIHRARMSRDKEKEIIEIKKEIQRILFDKIADKDLKIKEEVDKNKFLAQKNDKLSEDVKNLINDNIKKEWIIFIVKISFSIIVSFFIFLFLGDIIFSKYANKIDAYQSLLFIIAPLFYVNRCYEKTEEKIKKIKEIL